MLRISRNWPSRATQYFTVKPNPSASAETRLVTDEPGTAPTPGRTMGPRAFAPESAQVRHVDSNVVGNVPRETNRGDVPNDQGGGDVEEGGSTTNRILLIGIACPEDKEICHISLKTGGNREDILPSQSGEGPRWIVSGGTKAVRIGVVEIAQV